MRRSALSRSLPRLAFPRMAGLAADPFEDHEGLTAAENRKRINLLRSQEGGEKRGRRASSLSPGYNARLERAEAQKRRQGQ